MKSEKLTYLLSFLFLIGMSFTSCSYEEDGDEGGEVVTPDPNPDVTEMGYISLGIGLEGVIETRAAGESAGIAVESYFNGLQIILYNSTNIAVGTHYYDIIYNHSGFTNNAGSGVSFNASTKTITLPAIPLKKMAHKIVAILNPANLQKDDHAGGGLQKYGYTGRDYNSLITSLNHSRDHLNETVDFYSTFRGASSVSNTPADRYAVEMGVNLFLINFWKAVSAGKYPGLYNTWLEDTRGTVNFLMSNADGPLVITAADVKQTEAEAENAANRKTISVERAVAKIGLFKGANMILSQNSAEHGKIYTGLSKGAKMTEPQWATDIINMRTYLIRRLAQVAPIAGTNEETPATERDYRYATDPNYDHISLERPGSSGADVRGQHFFYVPDDSYLVREWISDSPSGDNLNLDANNRYRYEYVTENTMMAGEQYEDVTTRIVLKCKYAPSGFAIGASYYFYRGHAFTHIQILEFLANPTLIPVSTYPELEGLVQVLADLETREIFWPDESTVVWPLRSSVDPNNPPGEPNESVSYRELSYYKYGVCYYAIPIRHFNDTESPDLMGYGRYGVVRNNVYRVIIEDVRGPGQVHIPTPEGPDDKGAVIDVDVIVSPWRVVGLHFDL